MNGLLAILILLLLKAQGKAPAAAEPKAEPSEPSKPAAKEEPAAPKQEPAKPEPVKPAPKPAPAKPSVKVGPAPKVTPVSWPQVVPKDLPPFPSGWEPDVPVPGAEVTRATQLLPVLWKGGKPGAKVVENTAGKWVTYLAFVPSKGRKGVAAYRVKPGYKGFSAAALADQARMTQA